MPHEALARTFEEVDLAISGLESRLQRLTPADLGATVDEAMALIKRLMAGYIADVGTKAPPPPGADLLETFKLLVKGDPSWNAIRDNCRELVYYRNCLNMDRRDALPPAAERMAVRTLRHVFLYMKTRCLREARVSD